MPSKRFNPNLVLPMLPKEWYEYMEEFRVPREMTQWQTIILGLSALKLFEETKASMLDAAVNNIKVQYPAVFKPKNVRPD